MTVSKQLIKPGAVLGLLGGGQLGQMFAQAAIQMGYSVVCLTPDKQAPIQRLAQLIHADYTDQEALQTLIAATAAVTYEFENVPVAAARWVAEHSILRPGFKALHIAQDRRLEKAFIREQAQSQVADYRVIETIADCQSVPAEFTFPALLKTARDGYDGKGQLRVRQATDLTQAWQTLGELPCVLEALVPFVQELSVVVARDIHGNCYHYPPILNIHKQQILAESWLGIALPSWVDESAGKTAHRIIEQLDYVGCLCIEFFQCEDQLIVNEIAPRPHNSAHGTIEAYSVSQYEQQLRALVGLPVVAPELRKPTVLLNVLGDSPLHTNTLDANNSDQLLAQILALPGVHYHDYGKAQAKSGRKMGHIIIEAPQSEILAQRVAQIKTLLASNQLS